MRRRSGLRSARRMAGFTVVELIVAMIISAILLAVAVPSFGELVARTRVKGAATTLQLALLNARSEATRSNAAVTIRANGGSWASGWSTANSSGTVIENQGEVKGGSISANVTTIVYMSSGRIRGATAPRFFVTNARTDTVRCVTADLSGRPYVKDSAC